MGGRDGGCGEGRGQDGVDNKTERTRVVQNETNLNPY